MPEILVNQIISQIKDGSPMRSIARVIPASSGDVKFPISKNDASSAWVGETAPRTPTTEPTLIERKPTVGTVFSYVSASEELMNDSAFPIQSWFVESVGDQLMKAEGVAFLVGNGTTKPTGILDTAPSAAADNASPPRSDTALQYLPTGDANGFGVLKLTSPTHFPGDVLYTTIYSLKSDYRRRAVWLMNSTTAGVIRKFKDGDGRYLWTDPLAAGQPPLLAGFPVVLDENAPDIAANAHPVLFGDFNRGYGIFDLAGIRITVDDNITEPGKVKFYIRKRVGGIVLDHNAVKAIKCATS